MSSSSKFMDPKSFREWWFSWASHQAIEFRQQCTWCKDTPSILACDGTKIGMTASATNIDPIERRANTDVLITSNRKLDRCFLSGNYDNASDRKLSKEAREHLRYLTSSNYKTKEKLSEEQISQRNLLLVNRLPTEALPLFRRFLQNSLSPRLLKPVSVLFNYLSYDAPLRALIPQSVLPSLKLLLDRIETGQYFENEAIIKCCNAHSPSIANLLVSAFTEDRLGIDADCVSLLNYLVAKVGEHNSNQHLLPAAIPITESYNPPKLGRAYYYRPDGLQIRQFRQFSIDKKSTGFGFEDDIGDGTCRKRYPLVTTKATTFLFLWFCPIHGHCYGFHIINGSEGRKDPACSLFNHLEKSPEVIYYDFACSLEEYFLNRESGYIKSTRLYHDIFHSYNHKCSNVYKSQQVQGLEGVNSSICEQFNSFLQCIKASTKHMSQTRFMFYVQYMVHLWNKRKKESFERKLRTAVRGTV